MRRLRAQARWYVGAGMLALLAAYFTHGLLITARADVWPRRAEGTGVATSCERDWRYLGAQWRCDVDITAETGQKLTQTVSQSQFTQADIGIPKPVTAIGARWEAVDQPYEHRFAKVLFVLLLAGGIALLIKPTYDLARVRTWRTRTCRRGSFPSGDRVPQRGPPVASRTRSPGNADGSSFNAHRSGIRMPVWRQRDNEWTASTVAVTRLRITDHCGWTAAKTFFATSRALSRHCSLRGSVSFFPEM